ncbi:MAG: hypothetical protein GXW99_07025 [Clostridiales bacterium]|nr:hypothetical protein [Clostridiales bacterium]
MTKDRMAFCIGNIEEKYVEEAAEYKGKSRRIWIRWSAAAACLCLLLTGLYLSRLPSKNSTAKQPTYDDGYAIHIPAVKLPNDTAGTSMDMVGLVVYQGRVYTQAEQYSGEQAEAVAGLIGEYVGYAKGTIDEWSAQDAYATEFASTYEGDVYSVKGYSPDFRLCISFGAIDSEQNNVKNIVFLENLNGIGVTNGGDLFEKRLHLQQRWQAVRYQEHENWDNGWPDYVYRPLDRISEEQINTFLETLCASPFSYVYETNPNFYDEGEQAHLFFQMDDGTTVELRLFAGGYVGYQSMGWYFVKMPGEIFDTIFNAC